VCQQFFREAQAIAQEAEFAEIIVGVYPDLCVHPQTARVPPIMSADEVVEPEIHTLIVGMCALSGQALAPAVARAHHVHRLDNCFYLLAGHEVIDQYLQEGAYLLTPGWVEHWQGHIARWGFDQQTARAFFQECASQLVLLDTGVASAASAWLQEFSAFLDISATVAPIGLDHFRLLLRTLVLEWRLDQLQQKTCAAQTEHQQLAEYMMAFDLLVQLTRIMDETEAIQTIMALAAMIYGAGRIYYLPVVAGCLGKLVTPDGSAVAAAVVPRELHTLVHERSVLELAQGFCVRIAYQGETVGIFGIDEIPYPERIQEYLNLAMTIIPLCGLAIANARTLTARERAEEALREKSAALARSNTELEQFAYIASHDLQAPLRKIISFSDLLIKQAGGRLDAKGADLLARICHSADRMRTLIDDLLAYSRVGRSDTPFGPVDLAALLPQVLDDLEQQIADAGGEVVVNPLPIVVADARQMQQLFQNLISNGLKFTRSGVPPVVTLTARQVDDQQVEITVRDNGIGFDEQFVEQIFLPFRRLHSTEEYPGTGIGLAICQKIILRHHGVLRAQSCVGAGAAFIITLRQYVAATDSVNVDDDATYFAY